MDPRTNSRIDIYQQLAHLEHADLWTYADARPWEFLLTLEADSAAAEAACEDLYSVDVKS